MDCFINFWNVTQIPPVPSDSVVVGIAPVQILWHFWDKNITSSVGCFWGVTGGRIGASLECFLRRPGKSLRKRWKLMILVTGLCSGIPNFTFSSTKDARIGLFQTVSRHFPRLAREILLEGRGKFLVISPQRSSWSRPLLLGGEKLYNFYFDLCFRTNPSLPTFY